MLRYETSFGTIELTEERKDHILRFHPEVSGVLNEFERTLQLPDSIIRSQYDPEVRIWYRYLPQHKKLLAIVVKMNTRHFILTAYLTKKSTHSS